MKKFLKVVGALAGIGVICGVIYSVYAEKKMQKQLQEDYGFSDDENDDFGFSDFDTNIDSDLEDDLEDVVEDACDFTEPDLSEIPIPTPCPCNN